MPCRKRRLLLLPLVAALLPASLAAQVGGEPAGDVQLGVSYFDVSGQRSDALALEFAYLMDRFPIGPTRPEAGFMVATDRTVYGHAGLRLPISIQRWMLAISLGVGAYHPGRAETGDLGSVVQFRSGIETGLRLTSGHTISVFFYHLSNDGLGWMNPGLEVLGLGWRPHAP